MARPRDHKRVIDRLPPRAIYKVAPDMAIGRPRSRVAGFAPESAPGYGPVRGAWAGRS